MNFKSIFRKVSSLGLQRYHLCPNQETFEFLQKAEALGYPREDRTLDEDISLEDALEYLECDLEDLSVFGEFGKWYMICTTQKIGDLNIVECADLCKIPGTPKLDWILLARLILSLNPDGVICRLRASTSWKRALEFKGIFSRLFGFEMKIIEEDNDEDFSEPYYEVIFYKKGKEVLLEEILEELF